MFHREGPTFFELVRQALSSTDAGYDLLAPRFEHTPFRTPDIVLDAAARQLGPVDRLLDLCCGTGAAMRVFRPNVHALVAGIDRSAGMLDEARKALEGHGGAAFSLVRGDALAMPFRASFDAVVSFGAFGHILEHDEPKLVASVKQALKPGGRFVFATTGDFPPFHPARLMATAFNGAMRVRNALIKPEFIMYYLTFLLPRATALLTEQGFEVTSAPMEKPYQVLHIVTATKLG